MITARIVLLLMLASPITHLYAAENAAPLTCIGKGDDPRQDFYGRKLNDIIDYNSKADKKISDLKKRNQEIDKAIKYTKEHTIPKLQERFRTSDETVDEAAHKESLNTQASFERQKAEAEAQRIDNESKSQDAFLADRTKINEEVAAIHLAQEKWQIERLSLVNQARKTYDSVAQAVETKIKATENKYKEARRLMVIQQQIEMRNFTNARSNPNYDEKAADQLSSTHQKALEILESNKQAELKAHNEEKRKAALVLQAELTRVDKLDTTRTAEYNRALEQKKEELQAAESRRSGRSAANQAQHDRRLETNARAHSNRLSRFRSTLDNARKAILDQVEEMNRRIANMEKEREENINGKPLPSNVSEAQFANEPEKYLHLQGIKQIEANKEKFKFIAEWWKEQGSKAEANEGRREDCTDCVSKKSPLADIAAVVDVPKIRLFCVQTSIAKKKAYTEELQCHDSNSSAGNTRNICVTQRMADYTQWSLNKAMECLSTPTDPIDPQVLFQKLNNESTFRFFHAYKGGQGLMQTITCAQDEVFGMSPSPYCGGSGSGTFRSSARKQLAATMDANPGKCGDYSSIFNFKQEARYDRAAERAKGIENRNNMSGNDYRLLADLADAKAEYPDYDKRLFNAGQESSCDFVSLQDGIHRNILSGLGLYLNYRSIAENDLRTNFPGIERHPQYNKIRDLTALVYYGPTGPSGAAADLARMAPGIRSAFPNLNKMTPAKYEEKLKQQFTYIRAIHRSEDAINDAIEEDQIQCVE